VGDLPIVGRLFGSQQDTRNKTEVVLSITPHLIRNLQRPPASASEFSAGTESSFRRRPETGARAPAQVPGARALPGGAPARVPPTGAAVPQPASQPVPQPAPQPASSAPLPVLPAPNGQGGMVPATSVGASATLPPAPPSVPPSQLPAAPPINITPLPPPEVTPVPPASSPVPASNAAFPNQK